MKLVIIAGGKGTRLGQSDVPKPMVKVADKTVLEHQLLLAKRYGIDEVFVLSGHLAPAMFDHLQDGAAHGLKITHVIEPYPLGTAGSVALLRHLLTDRFLVFYGDVMLDLDLHRLLAFDRAHPSLGTLVVHPNDHPYDSDLLEVDETDEIQRWHAKPHPEQAYLGNLVNAGAYVLSPDIFNHVPFGKASDFGRDIFPALLRDKQRLVAYRTPEFIRDMGTPERLHEIEQAYLDGRIQRFNRSNPRKAVFLDRDGVVLKFVDHLSWPDDLELAPGAAAAVRAINHSEYLAVLVTNQPMIAKGFLTVSGLHRLHAKMETLLGHEHAYLDALYYCPHHPQSGFEGEIPHLKVDCRCRKPNPGMLLTAAEDLNIDLPGSWMIGDSECDLIAGRRAGCRTIQVHTGLPSPWADDSAGDLKAAVNVILSPADRIPRKEAA